MEEMDKEMELSGEGRGKAKDVIREEENLFTDNAESSQVADHESVMKSEIANEPGPPTEKEKGKVNAGHPEGENHTGHLPVAEDDVSAKIEPDSVLPEKEILPEPKDELPIADVDDTSQEGLIDSKSEDQKENPDVLIEESKEVPDNAETVLAIPVEEAAKEVLEVEGEKNEIQALASDIEVGEPAKETKAKKKKKEVITDKEVVSEASPEEKTESTEESKTEVPKEDIVVEKDYSTLTKDELVDELNHLLQLENIKLLDRKVKELKPFYDEFYSKEKQASLDKFIEEGGVEMDFQYNGDAIDNLFSSLYGKYKAAKNNYYAGLEKQKEENLHKKHEILEKLRLTVDGEETTTSIGKLKEIQQEWRSIGPVPNQHAKSLWATYNILIDRFYDNRSIYFELKELDRKKNLEAKIEICEKAEELAASDSIKDAVKELNELHEEFKHVGPVPQEMQEVIWQRFKSASDSVYSRRKDYVVDLKKELTENFQKKEQLAEEVRKLVEFDSDKISEWNDKTKELLELQKKWESIGGLPREHARQINKHFWSNFKTFFNNKNKFFKKLEGQRDENLKRKEELIKRASELKTSDDWENTANKLKELQTEWKNIGPVPEKIRNEVYKKFKAACDEFFNNRREHSKDIEKVYRDNLQKKEEICDKLEKLAEGKEKDLDAFKKLQGAYESIGFVPRNAIKKIQQRYSKAVEKVLSASGITESEKSEIKFSAEINKIKSSPNADRMMQRKENDIRRMINKLENDISLWRNNLEFFAASKNADKLRKEFDEKIAAAEAELQELKDEIKVLNKM